MPGSYVEWKHCIELDCGIPLTASFCRKRLAALQNPTDPHTAAFRRQWGDEHLERVIGWFHHALETDASS